MEAVGLALVDGIFSRDEGDLIKKILHVRCNKNLYLKSITPPSFLIMSARQESAEQELDALTENYAGFKVAQNTLT